MESFRDPSRRDPDPVCPRCHSLCFWLNGRLRSSPSAAGGCDGSHGAGAERLVLAGVSQISGPLRGPDFHTGPRQAQTRASSPQGSAARFLAQEKQDQSGGTSRQQTAYHSPSGNGCRSVFLSCSWTGLRSPKLPVTHSVIPEHLH